MVLVINTASGKERMSTQDLLQTINQAIETGERDFEIHADGQHDIGGPLWTQNGDELHFKIYNPGQRVGSMCLPGTKIVVEGSAPADVGWLNAGGEIILKGDGGDTTAHCAAAGKIYVAGRAGTRTGSLMKFDPAYEQPELWVLKNIGSFAFEFMSGGIAVVCNLDAEDGEFALGDRACVGMVGGTIYFRGKAQSISTRDTKILDLTPEDVKFLEKGIPEFIKKVEVKDDVKKIYDWNEWKKITPLSYAERPKKIKTDIKAFRLEKWVEGGIFSDVYKDNLEETIGLVAKGSLRSRAPKWENYRYLAPCEDNCPIGIPTQTRFKLLREGSKEEAYKLILEYSPFPGSVCGETCPNPCMDACTRCVVDSAANISKLGSCSTNIDITHGQGTVLGEEYASLAGFTEEVELNIPLRKSGKKIAVIGAGVAGLTAAWHLVLRGHEVDVYEQDKEIGGKLMQVIPRERLPIKTLKAELKRIQDAGVKIHASTKVDQKLYTRLKQDFDAVVIASGAHIAKVIPWPGHEKIVKGIDFLKSINNGEKVKIGQKVVVIGCGNSGMDAALGAYEMGAKQVTCIDVQAPAAFKKEIDRVEALGGKLRWPVVTEKITEEGLVTKTGEVIPADTVIINIGENPDLSFLDKEYPLNRGTLVVNEEKLIDDKVYAIGDVVKPGRLADAMGAAREVAMIINARLWDMKYEPAGKKRISSKKLKTAYFKKYNVTEITGDIEQEANKCISCGSCRDCQMCLVSCPEGAISRITNDSEGTFTYVSDPNVCIGCGICEGVCPCGIWTMYKNDLPVAVNVGE